MFRVTYFFKGSSQPLAAIMLAGVLLLGTDAAIARTASTDLPFHQSSVELKQSESDRLTQTDRRIRPEYDSSDQQFPRHVARKVRRALAAHLNISRRDVQVIGYHHETWSDSCLGLGSPVELCAFIRVEGWRVEVTDGDRSWFYRTDVSGDTIRMEQSISAGLPHTVRDCVLQAASERSGISVDQIRMLEAESIVWNGCLGIDPGPNGACTEIAIDGWRIVVEADSERLVYHTNHDGSDVRLASAITL